MDRAVTLPPDEPAVGGVRAGGWYHADDGGRLVCDLCPRGCALADGDRGFCFVRQRRGGAIVSTTYGRSTGFCIDPIEKKPLNHFFPGSAVLSFGTAGCNLGCKFCQNWSISKSKQVASLSEEAAPEAIAQAARHSGCRSVAFTYNDPVIWAEYAIDTARACRAAGVKTVAVTAGYITPLARGPFYQFIDAANVDLKGYTEQFYWRLTGGHLQPVLDTLRWLVHETPVWVELTNLVIPRANDTADELARMCDWIAAELRPDVPLHFSAFHPDFRMTDRGPTPLATLLAAHRIARAAGLKYVYTGNVHDPEHQSTHCPGCGRVVVQRQGYQLGRYEIRGGACRHCGTAIAGHWTDTAGDWGSRRQPIRIADYAPSTPPPARPATMPVERPQLSAADEEQVFRAAGARVAAEVFGRPRPDVAALLGPAADRPVYGAFVSLKRSGQLRSCCGFIGETVPLASALEHAAVRAAKDDPRFPPISASELPYLDAEVWLLWGLERVDARGDDRRAAVEIGRHGVQIARGGQRGLLLPGVAVEHGFDAERFLERVSIKAGLPPTAWRDDQSELYTFEGQAIRGRLMGAAETAAADSVRPNHQDAAALAEFCRANIVNLLLGATPTIYLPGGYDGNVCGLSLVAGLPGSDETVEAGTLSLRADRPLQATLYSLAEAVAGGLSRRGVDRRTAGTVPVAVAILFDPALHGRGDAADLAGVDPRRRALLVNDGGHTAWVFDPQKSAGELLDLALARAKILRRDRATVASLAVAASSPRAGAAYIPPPTATGGERPPAVLGTFYPAKADELEKALDELLPAQRQPQPWPAAMVPHAGWVYSGKLAARTLARVAIPPQVIVLCPKHRPGGATWAVAPHQTWSLPGRGMASDPELAARLAAAVGGLELDAAAHRQEHAIEVQLPILARLAPQSRAVGITIGGGELDELLQFGAELAEAIRPLAPRPLLVISSDMNHYASDADTRPRDRQALEAMASLDPARLYRTVRDAGTSMCGVMPAVIVMEALRRLESLTKYELVGYTTSGEASGDYSRVVGYAGVLLG